MNLWFCPLHHKNNSHPGSHDDFLIMIIYRNQKVLIKNINFNVCLQQLNIVQIKEDSP